MLILFIVITCGAGGTLTAIDNLEVLLKKYKFPRPLLLTLVLLLSCVGHLLIAFGIPNCLYFASVIIGFCFGAQWPLFFCHRIRNLWPQILFHFDQCWWCC
ncbi:unnamed protein product [Prunus brigantina]